MSNSISNGPDRRLTLPRGLLGLLVRGERRLARVLRRPDLSFLSSNIALLLRPLELVQYAVTFVSLCASSDHLGRRADILDSSHSKVFLRPLSFFLVTATASGLIIPAGARWLLPLIGTVVPAEEWKRNFALLGFVLLTPLMVAVLSVLVRVPIVVGSFFIPKKHTHNPEAWWTIPFLFDLNTWRRTKRPEVFRYLLYIGPYVLLASSVLTFTALWTLQHWEIWTIKFPGELSPRAAIFICRVVWGGFWAVIAERVVVNSFAAGLPMVMSEATYAMTRMVIPAFYRDLNSLRQLVGTIQQCRSAEQVVALAGPLSRALVDIEFDVFFFRDIHFPFVTDFSQLYPESGRLLEALSQSYLEKSAPWILIEHVRAVLKGNKATRFETGEVLLS